MLDLGDGDALPWVLLEHPPDELLAGVGELQVGGVREVAVVDALRRLGEILWVPGVREGVPPDQHNVEMHPARPHIRRLAVVLLRCLQHLLHAGDTRQPRRGVHAVHAALGALIAVRCSAGRMPARDSPSWRGWQRAGFVAVFGGITRVPVRQHEGAHADATFLAAEGWTVEQRRNVRSVSCSVVLRLSCCAC